MDVPGLLVTFDADAPSRSVIEKRVGGGARVVYLADLGANARSEALSTAVVVLARNTALELKSGEASLLGKTQHVQFVTAGVDYIPLADLPRHLTVASNGGAYAEPMAEHAVALMFAAAKRLFVEHDKLKAGTFDQFKQNRMLAGAVCGILGFGGIGVATARLMRALGMKVHAINRRGETAEPVDWIGRTRDLDTLLRASDVLLLSLPLTPASTGLIGRRELGLMKRDAILVNLARGEIIDEAALYDHLVARLEFTACIDAWWIEPVRHGRFAMEKPFLSLPNVIGSPHNSASVRAWRHVALERAVDNALRAFVGEMPRFLVPPEDRMM